MESKNTNDLNIFRPQLLIGGYFLISINKTFKRYSECICLGYNFFMLRRAKPLSVFERGKVLADNNIGMSPQIIAGKNICSKIIIFNILQNPTTYGRTNFTGMPINRLKLSQSFIVCSVASKKITEK